MNVMKKKQTHKYGEKTGSYQWREGRGKQHKGEAIGCKIGYKDVLYNMGNRANIL